MVERSVSEILSGLNPSSPSHSKTRGRVKAKRSKRRGALLLVVLMVLVILAMAMTEVARTTTRSTRSVLQRQRQFQRRVAIDSVETVLAPRGLAILGRAAPESGVTDQITLSPVRVTVRVGDENARLNLNMMYDRAGPDGCLAAAEGLIGGPGAVLRPRRPSVRPHGQRLIRSGDGQTGLEDGPPSDGLGGVLGGDLDTEPPPALASWGEAFDLAAFPADSPPGLSLPALTDRVTLWGNGRLNVWRAERETIVAAAVDVVPIALARRLAWKLRRAKIRQVHHVLRQTITNDRWRTELEERLTDLSETSSLWIGAEDGHVAVQRLLISSSHSNGTPGDFRFDFP